MNLHAGALPQLSSPASHCPTLAPAPAPGGRYASQKPLRPPCTRWPAAADASWSSSPPLQHTAAAVAGRSPVGPISRSHVWPLLGVGRGSYVISLRLSGESAPCPSHRRIFDSPLQVCCTQVALRKHRRGFISLPTHAPLSALRVGSSAGARSQPSSLSSGLQGSKRGPGPSASSFWGFPQSRMTFSVPGLPSRDGVGVWGVRAVDFLPAPPTTFSVGGTRGFSLFPDIDECLSSSCEGHCVNTEGGFVCECGPGMQLSADRHSCQGEQLRAGQRGRRHCSCWAVTSTAWACQAQRVLCLHLCISPLPWSSEVDP